MADTKKLCNLYELAQLSSQSAEEDSTETSSSRRGMTSWGGEDLNSSCLFVLKWSVVFLHPQQQTTVDPLHMVIKDSRLYN
jgi:hypothetical protein